MMNATDILFELLSQNELYGEEVAIGEGFETLWLSLSPCSSCGSRERYSHIGYDEICYECREFQS